MAWQFHLADLFETVAATVPDRLAIVSDSLSLTYAELDARSCALASGLAASGVGRGDTVGLYMGNRAEYLEGFIAACSQARGAILAGHVANKGRAIGRAARIVEEGLRAGLNLREGGKLANDLHELYGYICLRLTHANLHNDEAAVAECQRLVQPLLDAWKAIAPQNESTPAH